MISFPRQLGTHLEHLQLTPGGEFTYYRSPSAGLSKPGWLTLIISRPRYHWTLQMEISHQFQIVRWDFHYPVWRLGRAGQLPNAEHGLILAYDDGDTTVENLFAPKPFHKQVFLLNDEKISGELIKMIKQPVRPFFDGVSHVAEKMLEFMNWNQKNKPILIRTHGRNGCTSHYSFGNSHGCFFAHGLQSFLILSGCL